MRRALHIALLVLAVLVATALPRRAHAVGDPTLEWQTLTTEHFEIHHPRHIEDVARRIADVAENAHTKLSPALGWSPKTRTQIVLTDDTDSANGSASALPYNTVRLFVTAPDDLSALADYDDWDVELVTHEYTHILHTDNITGLPAIYNAIFGKTYAPNQMQPRWILEGLAVLQESYFTSGGRERSSTFDMWLRADVLEDNIAGLDEISHDVRRWPEGNLWYLYGSHFLAYIQDLYGPEALRSVSADYGSQIIPYGLNRAIHHATGKTYVELYEGWIGWMKKAYAAQRAEVEKRGIREGKRLTFDGYDCYHPRYAPASAGFDAKRPIAYFRGDGHSTGGLYTIDASMVLSPPKLLARTAGPARPSFFPDGGVLYDSTEVWKKVYFYWDLFRRPQGDWGDETTQGTRLTEGMRANEPDLSPNGERVAFVVNTKGTRYLYVADVHADGIGTPRKIVESKRFEQVYTPRWSPDGNSIAYSRWTDGGYRDVVIVEVETGKITEVTHDRALDTGPAFSPDGKRLYFASDRTGISNVYAYELATGALRQITNVVNGAYQPDPSPDGEHLVYVGYTHEGYDLFELALDPKKELDAAPYVDDRGARPPEPSHVESTLTPYDPWPTLRPYSWSFKLQPDAFGQAVLVTTTGGDVVGHHAFSLSIGAGFEGKSEPSVDFSYAYRRWWFDMTGHVYRFIAPRGGYRFGGDTPIWIEQTVGADVGVVYPISRSFTSQSLALSYSFAQFKAENGFPTTSFDPYSLPPVFPQTGFLGTLHLGYSWSNIQQFLWSVGAEKGFALGVSMDVARRELASDYDVLVASYSGVGYLPMPWARHHTLAIHAQGGASVGNFDRRGAFVLGGYVDIPIPDAIRNLLIQPGVALRGYAPGSYAGDSYQLFNVEYRFPIREIDRGYQTLPVFLQRLYADVFFDYGDTTFGHLDFLHMKKGVGAELLTDFTIGYFENFTMKIGAAYGLNDKGIRPHSGDPLGKYLGQTYIVLANLF